VGELWDWLVSNSTHWLSATAVLLAGDLVRTKIQPNSTLFVWNVLQAITRTVTRTKRSYDEQQEFEAMRRSIVSKDRTIATHLQTIREQADLIDRIAGSETGSIGGFTSRFIDSQTDANPAPDAGAG